MWDRVFQAGPQARLEHGISGPHLSPSSGTLIPLGHLPHWATDYFSLDTGGIDRYHSPLFFAKWMIRLQVSEPLLWDTQMGTR